MFLQQIVELGLLERNPESNILSLFPIDVKTTIISKMNGYLIQSTNPEPASILTSPAHVKFVMEIVGQGFDLPIEHIKIIQNSVKVYSTWLLEPSKRPMIVSNSDKDSEVFQSFIQSIFKQSSLLFRPRMNALPVHSKNVSEDGADALSQHIELCEKVLAIFMGGISDNADNFSDETWLVILKVFLGVCDSLLSAPTSAQTKLGQSDMAENQQVVSVMGDRLCESLIRTIFQVWLVSKTLDINMWNKLKSHYVHWCHRVQSLIQWCTSSLALTKLMVSDLNCEADEGFLEKEGLEDNPDGKKIDSSSMNRNQLYYSWHRLLYMIPNPATMEAPSFQTAIGGLSKLVDELHLFNLQERDQLPFSEINGNTILHMFGNWLLDAAAMSKPGYEIGRADALATLCRIFSKLQPFQEFHPFYLRKFYYVLKKGLEDDILARCSIVLNGHKLFSMNLAGFSLLIPNFIESLSRILPFVQASTSEFHGQKMDLDALRRGGYQILGSIIFGLDYLDTRELKFKLSDISLPQFVNPKFETWITDLLNGLNYNNESFTMLKKHILFLLTGSLITESSIKNCKYLLSLIGSYSVQEAEKFPEIFSIFIKVIQEKLLIPDHWPNEVILGSFDVLSLFVCHINPENPSNKNCIKELLVSLCRYLDVELKVEELVQHQLRIVRAFDQLSRWSLIGTTIRDDSEVQKMVLSALSKGVVILDREHGYSTTSNPTNEVDSSNSILSVATIQALEKLSESFKGETTPLSTPQQSTTQSLTPTPISKKQQSRMTMVPARRLAKLLNAQPSSSNVVSTPMKDAGLGLPTFAVLSTEIQIKTSAETAMSLILNRLGNYPPTGSCMGLTRFSSAWNETSELSIISDLQGGLQAGNSSHKKFRSTLSEGKFLRYFAFQKRLIFGFLERPHWSSHANGSKSPFVALLIREPTGRHDWLGEFEYGDKTKVIRKTTLMETTKLPVIDREVVPKHHFQPSEYPYTPTNGSIVDYKCAIEDNIPALNDFFSVAAEKQSYDEFYSETLEQTKIEFGTDQHYTGDTLQVAKPEQLVDSENPNFMPKHFRLFLSSLGYLNIQNHSDLKPLMMSEELLQDLEKLDQLPDRECYSFCVLYRYTTDIIEDIFKPADCANHEFNSFLWSLGWQVELKTHLGFKGNFTFDKIPLVPYFGNLNTEVIFISPELIRNEPQKMNTKMQIKKANSISNKDSTKNKGLERKATLSSDRISNSNQTNNQSKGKDKSRSRSKTMNTQVEMTKSDFECKIENDIVCVVWTDDILNLNCYIEDLPPNLLVAIVINPVANSPGLFLIQICERVGLPIECSGIGPLAHDIIVGKSNLGALVRQTAVNIHKSYNISKCIYKRPALIRRQLIEEICNRNMNSNNGLMTEILTQ
ncbi:hypothetical protein BC833DRAFT_579619 [Globomyces pollinis-pini]|nr:hypothetical protein BC833DRAFT_579619 [Globomyces pollinis-pini]